MNTNKVKSIALLILTGLFGLMMVNSGLNKFFQHMAMPEMPAAAMELMAAFGKSGWMFPLIAIVEIIGGVLIVIPRTRALGAIIILPIVVGIALFHFTLAPDGAVIGLVLLAINVWAIIDNKNKYMPMIQG